ncbi:MAG: DUF4143 domain-containing protein [Candidatus Gracilibacteria bacterium]|nr:DUF4143 domain-containing protein [Candidatus Gracilibacteria bacterium]
MNFIFRREFKQIENIRTNFKITLGGGKNKITTNKLLEVGLWQIKKLGSSLVGRIKEIYVYPFSFYEFLELKNIDIKHLSIEKYKDFMYEKIEPLLKEFYLYGGYPAVLLSKTKEEKIDKISEILEMYLKKDIYYFLTEKEVISFKKLFSYLSYNISSSVNISKLSSYLGINRKKIEYYLEILEKSFLLYKVYPFYNNNRKEYSKTIRIFLNDTGIINFLKSNFNLIEFEGELIENFSFLELLKNKKLNSDEIKTYNKLNGSEIDFIYCYKEGGIIPIEIKLKNNDIIPKIFNSFEKDYEDNIRLFIRTSTNFIGNRIIKNKEVKVIPFFMLEKIIND